MTLTKIDCQTILENRFNNKNIKYIDHELKPISENNEGYMGEHYKLTISYEINGEKAKEELFMKQKPSIKTNQEIADSVQIYTKEIFLYEDILKEFKKRGYDISFSPESFYCIPDQALIMENKISQGYKLLERAVPFNMNKIQCLLKSLALFHGAGFAYEESKSKELGKPYKFTDEKPDLMKEGFFCQYLAQHDVIMRMWESSRITILSLIDNLSTDVEFISEFKTLLSNYKLGKIFAEPVALPQTIGHGDLWSNNMMFKFDGDDAIICCLVDYQLFRRFYPVFDVFLGIHTNTTADFRKKHFDELIQYYYKTLSEILKNYGYSVENFMTFKQFIDALPLVKVEVLAQVVLVNSYLVIPKEILTENMKDDDSVNDLMYNNVRRTVKAFNTDDNARKVLSENLYDLYNALVERNNS